MTARIDGLEEALAEINSAIAEVKDVSQAALWEAGLKIMNRAQHNLKGSVITGNLRASGYVRPANGQPMRTEPERLDTAQNAPIPGDRISYPGVELGFTALYALNVHENLQGSRTPKYLERPVVDNVDNITRIIKSRTGGE